MRWFINLNIGISMWLSKLAELIVPRDDGYEHFVEKIVPDALKQNMRVLDVGGGKRPLISLSEKQRLNLRVTGLDISAEELAQAPDGAYDDVVVGSVEDAAIDGQYDLIFSCAVLEHVPNPRAAIDNLSNALKSGGVMLHFLPCKNAPFAKLNLLLGNSLAKKILYALLPSHRSFGGFKAYYRDCSPSRFEAMCEQNKLAEIEATPYFVSEYTKVFAPAFAMELARQSTFSLLGLKNLAETFVIRAKRPIETEELRKAA